MTQGRSRSHWGGDWYDTDRDAHRRDVAGSGAGGLRRRLAGARRRRNEGRAIADGIGFAGCGAGGRVVMPPSWMPADWDRNVHGLGGQPMKADTEREFRQGMVAVTPFHHWAVATDKLVPEA